MQKIKFQKVYLNSRLLIRDLIRQNNKLLIINILNTQIHKYKPIDL